MFSLQVSDEFGRCSVQLKNFLFLNRFDWVGANFFSKCHSIVVFKLKGTNCPIRLKTDEGSGQNSLLFPLQTWRLSSVALQSRPITDISAFCSTSTSVVLLIHLKILEFVTKFMLLIHGFNWNACFGRIAFSWGITSTACWGVSTYWINQSFRSCFFIFAIGDWSSLPSPTGLTA